MKLWAKILIALVLGVITGLTLGPNTVAFIKPIGDIFLRLINMLIMPLVLASMTVGITSIHDPKKLGRVGIRTLLAFLITTMIAIVFGIAFAKIFDVGAGLNLLQTEEVILKNNPSSWDIILSTFPSNPIASLAEGNILQVIVFSIFLGMAINFSGEKGKPLLKILESLADVMYRMTSMIMEFSPYGVYAIMTYVSATFGVAVLVPLIKFLVVYYAVCLLHMGVVFCSIIYFMAKLNPKQFFRNMSDAIMMAFSTCSSSATLPVSMHCVEENLGVSKNLTNFILPLGTTINMNGAAIYQGMAVFFIANAYNLHLDLHSYVTIVLTATLAAIGAAGIPGSGFIMLSVVLASVGLPIEGMALLAGIDRIREMGSTVLNVLGDGVVALYVARKEGELDENKYYKNKLVELEL